MIYDGMTTEELFICLESWNKFYNIQTLDSGREICVGVIDRLVTTLQMHWL